MIHMEKINLELGRIEGIGIGLGGDVGEKLQLAADRIGRAIRAELAEKEDDRWAGTDGRADAADKVWLEPGTMTTGEAGELADRLAGYYCDHVAGKTMSISRIVNDCVRAAGLIEFLLEERSQRDWSDFAGKP